MMRILAACFLMTALFVYAEEESLVPYIKSDWQLLFKPEKTGDYINDHTLYQDTAGKWHLIGITRIGQPKPEGEVYFAHGVGESLTSGLPFTEQEKICDYGDRAWAPHSVNVNGVCHLFYGPDRLKLDTSKHMVAWQHQGVLMTAAEHDPKGTFRDTMTIKYGDKWLMYSTGMVGHYGTIDVWESADLKEWKLAGRALTTSGKAPLNPKWSACESPFVVKQGNWYYLFVTYTDCSAATYQNTMVFKSKDPTNFGDYDGDDDNVVTRLATHAPEVVLNPDDGKWYITSCGWSTAPTVKPGGVAIAELGWYAEGNEPEEVKGNLLQSWAFDEPEDIADGTVRLAAGKVGKAARFDGKGGWVDMPDLYLNRDFTVTAWIQFEEGIDNNDVLLGQEEPGQNINFHDGRLHVYAPKDIYTSKTVFKPGEWYHVALVRSEHQNLKVYVNGEPDGAAFWVGCFMPKAIGRGSADSSFDGLIDELSIFSCAKTEEEIMSLMGVK